MMRNEMKKMDKQYRQFLEKIVPLHQHIRYFESIGDTQRHLESCTRYNAVRQIVENHILIRRDLQIGYTIGTMTVACNILLGYEIIHNEKSKSLYLRLNSQCSDTVVLGLPAPTVRELNEWLYNMRIILEPDLYHLYGRELWDNNSIHIVHGPPNTFPGTTKYADFIASLNGFPRTAHLILKIKRAIPRYDKMV
jgi:hypothetical protein